MEKFVVSARKYRPLGFEEVVGQAHITTTLQNAIDNNQVAQALLFCGPRGVGKTTCARIVARKVNATEDSQATDLGLSGNTPMNIYELDAASNNSVDDIRNLIDQVRYPPQQGRYKVYIIDEVHMLSNQAFNAFLKTLEEPPPYAIFILATTEKHKVIPTILSRCQIFDFNRIQVSDITRHLHMIAQREGIEAEEEALHLIGQKADGALRDALSIFDLIVTFSTDKKITYQNTIEHLHILDYDYYFRVTDALREENLAQVLLIFDEILNKGFDGHNFIVGLSEHFRNLLVCKDKATVKLLEVSEGIQEKYLQQAKETPLSFLLTTLNIGSQCDMNYKSSKNQRLHVELALMKMAHISAAIQLADLKENTAASEPFKKKTEPQPEKEEEGKQPTTNGTIEPQTNGKSNSPTHTNVQLSSLKSKTTTRIPNLQEIGNSSFQNQEKEEVAVVEEEQETREDAEHPISEESLQKVWKVFAERKKQAGKDSEFTILNQEIHLHEDGVTLPLTLTNPLQEDLLNGFRGELLQFLRSELRNSQLRLDVQIVKDAAQKKLYTPREKFNYLLEKYPALQDLKDRLGLDPDY